MLSLQDDCVACGLQVATILQCRCFSHLSSAGGDPDQIIDSEHLGTLWSRGRRQIVYLVSRAAV